MYLFTIFVVLLANVSSVKINTPRALLPWFDGAPVSFVFEIENDGCYTWSMSREDALDLEVLSSSGGGCARSVRVTPITPPPASVIIMATDSHSQQNVHADVDIEFVTKLSIVTTSHELYLDEAPEAYSLHAYDHQGDIFTTLDGVDFDWMIYNVETGEPDDSIVRMVWWRDTQYSASPNTFRLESENKRGSSVLLVGASLGSALIRACRGELCTEEAKVTVRAAITLLPAAAVMAPYDKLTLSAVQMRVGILRPLRLDDPDHDIVSENVDVLRMIAPATVMGMREGIGRIVLHVGGVEASSSKIEVSNVGFLKIKLRPGNMIAVGGQAEAMVKMNVIITTGFEKILSQMEFQPQTMNKGRKLVLAEHVRNVQEHRANCVSYLITAQVRLISPDGRVMHSGSEVYITATATGVELLPITKNGTIHTVLAYKPGPFKITATLLSIAGKKVSTKVSVSIEGVAVEPLKFNPANVILAWCSEPIDHILSYNGGEGHNIVWSASGSVTSKGNGRIHTQGLGTGEVTACMGDSGTHQVDSLCSKVNVRVEQPRSIEARSNQHVHTNSMLHVHITVYTDSGLSHGCSCLDMKVESMEGPNPDNYIPLLDVKPEKGACCVLGVSWSESERVLARVRGCGGTTVLRVQIWHAAEPEWPVGGEAVLAPGGSVPLLASPNPLWTAVGPAKVERTPANQFKLICQKPGDVSLTLTTEGSIEDSGTIINVSCITNIASIKTQLPSEECGRIYINIGDEKLIEADAVSQDGRNILDESGGQIIWKVEPNNKDAPQLSPPYATFEGEIPRRAARNIRARSHWSGKLVLKSPTTPINLQIPMAVIPKLKVEPKYEINILYTEAKQQLEVATFNGGSGVMHLKAPSSMLDVTIVGHSLYANIKSVGEYTVNIIDACTGQELEVLIRAQLAADVQLLQPRTLAVSDCQPMRVSVSDDSGRTLTVFNQQIEYQVSGNIEMIDGKLCGVSEGLGYVTASLGKITGKETEVSVYRSLSIEPTCVVSEARVRLTAQGGPPRCAVQWSLASHDDRLALDSNGWLRARAPLKAIVKASCDHTHTETPITVVQLKGVQIQSSSERVALGGVGTLWIVGNTDSSCSLDIISLDSSSAIVHWIIEEEPGVIALANAPSHLSDDNIVSGNSLWGLVAQFRGIKVGEVTVHVTVKIQDVGLWKSSLRVKVLGLAPVQWSSSGRSEQGVLDSVSGLLVAPNSPLTFKSNQWMHNVNVDSLGIQAVAVDDDSTVPTAILLHVVEPKYMTLHYHGDGVVWKLRDSFGRHITSHNITRVTVKHSRADLVSITSEENLLRVESINENDGVVLWTEYNGIRGAGVVRSSTGALSVCEGGVVCADGPGWNVPTAGRHKLTPLNVLWAPSVGRSLLSAQGLPDRTIHIQVHSLDKLQFAENASWCTIVGEWNEFELEPSCGVGRGAVCSEGAGLVWLEERSDQVAVCSTNAPNNARTALKLPEGKIVCMLWPTTPGLTELTGRLGNRSASRTMSSWHAPRVTLQDDVVLVRGPSPMLDTLSAVPSPGVQLRMERLSHDVLQIGFMYRSDVCQGWLEVRVCGRSERVTWNNSCGGGYGKMMALLTALLVLLAGLYAGSGNILYKLTRTMQQKTHTSQGLSDPNITSTFMTPTQRLNQSFESSRNSSRNMNNSSFEMNEPSIYGESDRSVNLSTRYRTRVL